MNDLTRASHDELIEKLQDKMTTLDPTSEEFTKVYRCYESMLKAANADDAIQVRAKAEELKIEAENEKTEKEAETARKTSKISLIIAGISSATSVIVYGIICFANKKVQLRSIDLERDGFAHTTRSSTYLNKIPNHKI